MTLQRRFGYGLLAAAVGSLAMAVGGAVSTATSDFQSLVLLNVAITLAVLAALQLREVASFEVESRHLRLVSATTTALVVTGVALTAGGALLALDAFLS